jgi:probable rRNA maturation factor
MSPEGSTVTFRRVPETLKRQLQRPLQRFARTLQTEVAASGEFDCLVTSDAELRRLNGAFRGHDVSTDVLSFPNEHKGPGFRVGRRKRLPHEAPPRRAAAGQKPWPHFMPHLGGLAISLPRARAQARQFGHEVQDEIRILMLHGLLHLLGMDHENDHGRMARAERRWRARLGLPPGLIERVAS